MAKRGGMKNAKVYVSVTAADGDTPEAQNSDLNQTAFEALDWQQVGNVGEIGEFGTVQEMATYFTLDRAVADKIKTTANAGDPVIECAEDVTDKGQIALKAAGATSFTDAIAIKFEYDDMPSGGSNNTIRYSRALIGGPVYPNGRIEDFQLIRFTAGMVQEVLEDPAV
jgi:hypothetical protein